MHDEEAAPVAACARHCWSALRGKAKGLLPLSYLISRSKAGFTACVRHGAGLPNCQRLSHSFIVLNGGKDTVFIVDPFFREQFQIGLRDDEYQDLLLKSVPEVFVGTPKALKSAARLICLAMQAALCRLDMPVAPWWDIPAILSKWSPESFRDETLESLANLRQGQEGDRAVAQASIANTLASSARENDQHARVAVSTSSTLRPPKVKANQPLMSVRGFELLESTPFKCAPQQQCQQQQQQQQPHISDQLDPVFPSRIPQTAVRSIDHFALPFDGGLPTPPGPPSGVSVAAMVTSLAAGMACLTGKVSGSCASRSFSAQSCSFTSGQSYVRSLSQRGG